MKLKELSREEIIKVIEGRGNAGRIPMLYHFWVYCDSFPEPLRSRAKALMAEYPMDVQVISLNMPDVFKAPEDAPSYRWAYRDTDRRGKALDSAGVIEDWETELDAFLKDFPSASYPGLIPEAPAPDGRYRLGHWWYFFFERFWSIRSMEDALMDFYLYPEAVHAFFDRLADFYADAVTRAKQELDLDGIFVSDDLGTQKATFFSDEIFDEFFYPCYKKVIDRIHELGMHFWLHTCGNVESFIPKFIELGIDVLHPIQKYTMDQKRIAEKFGKDICIWAGFDVQQVIPYGTPEEVRQEVRRMIDTYKRDDGRFMLTMGNGATADTPFESLKALMEETAAFRF